QDIVFDAYRTDLLPEAERGAGAAVSVLGYRVAMLVSGGVAMIVADQWLGWPVMFRAMGVLFVLLSLVTLWAPRAPHVARLASDVHAELLGFVAMLAAGFGTFWLLRRLPWEWIGTGRLVSLAVDTLILVLSCVAALQA